MVFFRCFFWVGFLGGVFNANPGWRTPTPPIPTTSRTSCSATGSSWSHPSSSSNSCSIGSNGRIFAIREERPSGYLLYDLGILCAEICEKYGVADPGWVSRIRIFSIPDPNFFHSGSLNHFKEFKYFNPKRVSYLSDPGWVKNQYPGSKMHRI